MPIPRRYYDELQQKRQEEHRVAERDKARDLARAGMLCVVWCVAGLFLFGCALHTTDALLGEIFRWSSYVVTYAGIFATLVRAYVRGERRGDW